MEKMRNKMSLNSDPSGLKDPEGFASLHLVILWFTLIEAELSLAFSWLCIQISLSLVGCGLTLVEQQLQ